MSRARSPRTAAHLTSTVVVLAASCIGCAGSGSTNGAGTTTTPPASPEAASAPSTVTATTEAVLPSTSPPPTSTTWPLQPGDFETSVPAIDGYTFSVRPERAVPWSQLSLPDGAAGFAIGVQAGGIEIGALLALDRMGVASYVEDLFDAPVMVQTQAMETGAGTYAVSNEARATWRTFQGVPVVGATLPDDDAGQWVWPFDDLTWIAVGSMAMEPFVDRLIAVQQASDPKGPYEYGLLGGALYDGLPIVPGYLYVDQPASAAVLQLPSLLAGDCARRVYLGHIAPRDDPDPLVMQPGDLGIAATTIGGACTDAGFFDDLDSGLRDLGFVDDVIAGEPVRRAPNSIVVVDGHDVVHLSSTDPATLDAMAPFITAFVGEVRPRDVTDDTTLAVGTCLFRDGAASDDPASRRTYATDCLAPHQGEVFHRFDVAGDGGAPYPGDGPASGAADTGCTGEAFTAYVGTDYASSRLNVLYYYPSADTWAAGDRGVMCIVHGDPEELFRTSFAGIAQ